MKAHPLVAAAAAAVVVFCNHTPDLCLPGFYCCVQAALSWKLHNNLAVQLAPLLQGETTRMLPKPHLSSNHWAFVTGSTVGSLPAGSQQAAAGLLERLLQGVGQQLQEKPGVASKHLYIDYVTGVSVPLHLFAACMFMICIEQLPCICYKWCPAVI